jgi:MFS family permease
MLRLQIFLVVLVVVISALGSFDIQIMALVAPVVGKAWAVGKATMGIVLASSLFGMAGGALLLSPLADVVGRRPMLLGGLALMSIGTIISAMSHQVWELAASRAITGLGAGMMLALTNTLAAEFSSARRRSFAVSTTIFGLYLGAILGSLVTSVVLIGHPWNWVFIIATAVGAVLFALVFVIFPESPVFLMARVSPNALSKLNKMLARLGHAEISALPVRNQPLRSTSTAFDSGTVGIAATLAVALILFSLAGFYVTNWLPQLITDAGFRPSTASLVSAVGGSVGMISCLSAGALGARIRPIIIASFAMVFTGLGLALLGSVPPTLTMLMFVTGIYALFHSAGLSSFNAAMTSSFSPLARVSGTGLVMGLGLLASGLGPYTAGLLFAAGGTRMSVSLIFAGAAVLAGLVLATAIRRSRGDAASVKIAP